MRKAMFPCFGLGGMICVLIASSVCAEERYRIDLSPPARVGDRYHYDAFETESLSSVVHQTDKPPAQANSYSGVEFDATIDVKACDPKGRPSEIDFTVNELSTMDIPNERFMDPGSVVTARRAQIQNKPPVFVDSFTRKEGPLDTAQDVAMRRVVTIGNEKEPTEQEAFGTDKPMPIGGKWPLDGEVGAKLFKRMKIDVDPKDVSGTATVAAETMIFGVNCLDVEMVVICNQYKPRVPAGEKLIKGSVVGHLRYHIEKGTGRATDSKYTVHAEIELSGRNSNGQFTDQRTFDASRSIVIQNVPR